MDDTKDTPVNSRVRRRAGLALMAVVAAAAIAFAGLSTRSPRAEVAPVASQVIAAGRSETNLAKESGFAGAQSPPYVCCWGSNGQYVNFAFNVPGGTTNLVLRSVPGMPPRIDRSSWMVRSGSRNWRLRGRRPGARGRR